MFLWEAGLFLPNKECELKACLAATKSVHKTVIAQLKVSELRDVKVAQQVTVVDWRKLTWLIPIPNKLAKTQIDKNGIEIISLAYSGGEFSSEGINH